MLLQFGAPLMSRMSLHPCRSCHMCLAITCQRACAGWKIKTSFPWTFECLTRSPLYSWKAPFSLHRAPISYSTPGTERCRRLWRDRELQGKTVKNFTFDCWQLKQWPQSPHTWIWAVFRQAQTGVAATRWTVVHRTRIPAAAATGACRLIPKTSVSMVRFLNSPTPFFLNLDLSCLPWVTL